MDIRNFKSEDADFLSSSRTLRKHFENMLAYLNAPFKDNCVNDIGVCR